ncbi:hypothetical protein ALP40_05455 [Pseudomonas viridiflava]|uniref:Uncharacterized protein n=1 Tax=Pseudomonas viridiflava TaxID=33069 RepID=A0A3M5PGM1_PSEVI|nr:hypothetical protein ALP40_05455 [Pseudomonas viridiflava]
MFVQNGNLQFPSLGQLRSRARPCDHRMGFRRHRPGHLGAQAFEFLLGDVATHALQRSGEDPGLPSQRQTFYGFLLAAPMHAEVLELGFDGACALSVGHAVKEIAYRLGLFLGQRLTHVQPVCADDRFQRAELVGQLLRRTGPDRGHVQLVDQPAQRGARSKLGAQLALILQLQAALTQQRVDHVLVVLVFEETVDFVSDFHADIRQVGEDFRQRLLDTIQRRQRAPQYLGRLLAYVRDTERVDEARQSRLAAVGNRFEQLFTGDFGKALQVDDLIKLKLVEISRRADEFFVHQLLDGLVAQAFDVHCAARHVMNDRLLELRATGQTPDAAIHRAFANRFLAFAAFDQLGAFDMGAAHRTGLRDLDRPGVLRTTLHDHLHHLRNDITGTANDHGVTDHQAQPCHLVHVVQRCIGNHHPRNLDGFQAGNGGDRAGAAHLEFDVQQLGQLFHCGKFMRNRPARLPGAKTQLALISELVDLEHHAINFVAQRQASLADVVVIRQTLFDAIGEFELAADRHAPCLELVQHAHMSVGDLRRGLTQAITTEFQRTIGRDLRIQLAQAARCGVARVGEGLAADFQLACVEPLETGLGHEHLAAHLQHLRPAGAVQFERDVTDGAHVDADVLPRRTVAPRRTAHQRPVAVQQTDCQTIQLGLATVLNLAAAFRQVQPFGHTTVELMHVVFFECVAQTEHRHFVAHLSERRQRRAADTLSGRVRRDQMRILGFKRLEFVEQAVVLDIGDAGFVQNVIAVVVLIQLCAQFQDSGFDGLHTVFSQKAKEQPGLLNRVVLPLRCAALAERRSTRAGKRASAATLSQCATLELNDALAVVLDGLRGHDAALIIFQLAVQFMRQLACCCDHHVKRLLGMTRTRQTQEEAHGAGAEMVDVVQIENPRLDGVGHREQHFAVTRHAFVTMEDVHLAETQAAFQDVLQQRRPFETAFAAGNHADDQHFLNRRQVFVFSDALRRLVVREVFVTAGKQARAVHVQIQVALMRLALALLVAIAALALTSALAHVVSRAGTHRRKVVLVQMRLFVGIQHTGRPQHFGGGRFLVVRKVGKAPIKPEFQFSLTAAHTAPAIEENTGNDNYADDDQPLAQTDFHVIQCL